MDGQGRIDAATFPNFGRLAELSTWYRNATTTGVMTHEALPALLTGRRNASAEGEAHNLFTMLGGAYDIVISEPVPGFCSTSLCKIAPDVDPGRWAEGFGFFPRGGKGRPYANYVEAIDGDAAPALYFIHTVMPHSPWRYLPSGQIYPEPEPEPGEIDVSGPGRKWSTDDWLTTQVYQRHLLQLKLTDRMLGVILDRLKAERMTRDAMVVVTADHGIGFVPGEHKRLVSEDNVGGIASIPLFVKLPGQHEGAVTDEPVQITDVVPAIAEALGLRTWPEARASSLADAPPVMRSLGQVALSAGGLEKYEVIAMKERSFGRDERGALDPFLAGPDGTAALVGTKAPPGVATSVSAHVDGLDDLMAAPTADESFPALLSGELVGAPERAIVVIAVDGVVAAVTRSYDQGSRRRFYAMLSPRYFHQAPHNIQLFIVDEGVWYSPAQT
jgi:hypothetical protein